MACINAIHWPRKTLEKKLIGYGKIVGWNPFLILYATDADCRYAKYSQLSMRWGRIALSLYSMLFSSFDTL